jgi:EAL domain-containing protein (putative c-di-GMP-specific phosphodiesterase class I)
MNAAAAGSAASTHRSREGRGDRLPDDALEGGDRPRGAPECTTLPRILIVDDDTHMLEVSRRVLRSLGYTQITTAGNAQDALLQLERDPQSAQIIICDLMMPVMDGIRFLQILNESPFRGSVILFSATGTRVLHSVQRLISGQRLTLLGALSKPGTRESLRALLASWQPYAASPAPSVVPTPEELQVANRERQWQVHYQPQVNLTTGHVVGVEALARWQHPRYGWLQPETFIAVAETCGAIDELTDIVAHQALEQQSRWRANGLDLRLAINVSMTTLATPGFWKRLRTLAARARARPQDVTIEVTETSLRGPSSAPLENLVRLRMNGFEMSIDDFGTGHSSLIQLRDIPFTELKVERSFVTGALNNQITRPILEGSLAIARGLSMVSVAEGVETAEDWLLLRRLGCGVGQGYFIARPMPGEDLWDWLHLWQERREALIAT